VESADVYIYIKGEKEKNGEKKKKQEKREKKKNTYIIADEQPSTLGVPNFKKVLSYRSP
jgi:hypothetical protein